MTSQTSSNKTFIQTYAGIAFEVLDPRPEQIWITDIAHALSNMCRFAGHTRKFYSVAQHSIIASENVPEEFAFEALMHDAAEAYVVDIPRPLKHSGLLDEYHNIEGRVWRAIATHYDLPFEMSPEVKIADNRTLMTEQRDLVGRQVKPWSISELPYDFKIVPLPPEEAERRFLARFNKLMRERG